MSGVIRKYVVTRADGSAAHDDCAFFVLDLDCDEFAIPALKAYIRACKATEPDLARDLEQIINTPSTRCNCREASCPHSLGQALMPDGPGGMAQQMMADAVDQAMREVEKK